MKKFPNDMVLIKSIIDRIAYPFCVIKSVVPPHKFSKLFLCFVKRQATKTHGYVHSHSREKFKSSEAKLILCLIN
jgi:hypothetical protein